MKKILVCFSALGLVVLSVAFEPMSKTGIAGFAGGPGEKNCTKCHGGNPNTGTGSITITAPDLIDWKYSPGKTYNINVTVTQTGVGLFGFAFEALTEAGADAGKLEVINPTETHIDSSSISGTLRKGITHALNGGKSTDAHTFTFKWIAPATDVGPVTFYSAGNAANGNNLTSGDFIYTKVQVISSAAVNVKEQDATVSLELFPNPTEDRLNINVNTSDKMSIHILDMNGRLLMKKENMFSNAVVDVSGLPAGMYLTRIETTNGVGTKRFMKK